MQAIDDHLGVTLESYASDRLDGVMESALNRQCEGDFAEAGELYKEALELARHTLPECNADVLAMECHLATSLAKQRDYRAAEPVLHRTLAKQSGLYPKNHPLLLSTKAKLAGAYHGQKKFPQAKLAYSEALTGLAALVGDEHPSIEDLKAKIRIVSEEEKLERQRLREQVKGVSGRWVWNPPSQSP
jgi:tetratricopeptide (TPR) repeat protein